MSIRRVCPGKWQVVMPLIKLLGENYAKGFVRGFAKKTVKQTALVDIQFRVGFLSNQELI